MRNAQQPTITHPHPAQQTEQGHRTARAPDTPVRFSDERTEVCPTPSSGYGRGVGAMDKTDDLYRDAVRQAHDLLRWRSPLRAELWASRLAAEWHDDDEPARSFVERATHDDTPEARLILTALASIAQPPTTEPTTDETTAGETSASSIPTAETAVGETPGRVSAAEATLGETAASSVPTGETTVGEAPSTGESTVGEAPARGTPAGGVADAPAARWMELMGRAQADGAWYGTADPYGEQALAVISFVYPNGKEPHLAVVGIDQANGGFAVDAVIEEPKFLDDLDVRPADPVRVAGRVIDAFELTDAIMGAPVADTFPQARAIVLARARTAEASRLGTTSARGAEGGRRSPDDTVERFDDLPDVPGASEAFATLVEFVGDRPSWWSPARVTQFITSWLPREAIMSEAAVDAMPQVLRAWTRHLGDHPEVSARVEADSRDLPLLMADGLRFSLAKRLRLAEREHRGTDR